jgi:hypothetical protein
VDEIQPSKASDCKVATVLGSISATSNTVEPEGWQMKLCEYLKYFKKIKIK